MHAHTHTNTHFCVWHFPSLHFCWIMQVTREHGAEAQWPSVRDHPVFRKPSGSLGLVKPASLQSRFPRGWITNSFINTHRDPEAKKNPFNSLTYICILRFLNELHLVFELWRKKGPISITSKWWISVFSEMGGFVFLNLIEAFWMFWILRWKWAKEEASRFLNR